MKVDEEIDHKNKQEMRQQPRRWENIKAKEDEEWILLEGGRGEDEVNLQQKLEPE